MSKEHHESDSVSEVQGRDRHDGPRQAPVAERQLVVSEMSRHDQPELAAASPLREGQLNAENTVHAEARDTRLGHSQANNDATCRGNNGKKRSLGDSSNGLYTDDDVDAGIGAIYNEPTLTTDAAKRLTQQIRNMIECSQRERQTLPPPVAVPAPRRREGLDACEAWTEALKAGHEVFPDVSAQPNREEQ